MKLGIYLNSQHPASDDPARRLAETLEQVRLIRALGFDSIWAGEHHITPGFHFFSSRSPRCCNALRPRPKGFGSARTLPCCHFTIRSSWPKSARLWT